LYRCGVVLGGKYAERFSRELERPVISVGNLAAGGTGKTPFVIHLARRLYGRGYQVGVILRGYRGRLGGGGPVVVSRGKGPLVSARDAGDEAFMMAEKLHGVVIAIGRDRFKVGYHIIKYEKVDVIILDDGFQFKSLTRDLDLVCLNATEPFGGRRLLPAGLLREPLSSLSRADGIVLSHADLAGARDIESLVSEIRQYNSKAWIIKSAYRPVDIFCPGSNKRLRPGEVSGVKVLLVSALGDNRQFFRTVSALGAEVTGHLCYPDHHWYTRKDMEAVAGAARESGAAAVITTAKDAVRMERFETSGLEIWVLNIELVLEDDTPLVGSLDRLFEGGIL